MACAWLKAGDNACAEAGDNADAEDETVEAVGEKAVNEQVMVRGNDDRVFDDELVVNSADTAVPGGMGGRLVGSAGSRNIGVW